MSETFSERPAPLPTYDEITELEPEILGFVVPADFEDENGHMNVRHYFDFGLRATNGVFERMGIDDAYRQSRHRGFFTAEHHVRYFAEVHVGEPVSVYFSFVARSDKVVQAMALVVDDATRKLVNSLEIIATHMNMNTRRVVAFDDDIAGAIDREFDRTAHLRPALPVCGALHVRNPIRVAQPIGSATIA